MQERIRKRWCVGIVAMLVSTLPGCAQVPVTLAPPEIASGWQDKPGWWARSFMVAAANPVATDVGYRVLTAGGSAVDAAIAVQLMLTLVEPQASGIGGGMFLVHFDGTKLTTFDGRETAPAAVDEALFLDAETKPITFREAVVGGRAVGVPGVLRTLELAHRRYGKRPWAELFQPAIELAETGFTVSPRLYAQLRAENDLRNDPEAFAYFYNADGTPKPVGTPVKNPALAATLREIAANGADVFYRGAIARDIVAKVRGHAANPGRLHERDLADYRVREREPVCVDYRRHRVCGMPPPSSGAVAVGQILGMLAHTDIAQHKPVCVAAGCQPAAKAVHLYAEAARLAYADRARYLADTDFVTVPVAGLLDADYLAKRARHIGERSMGKATAGTPAGAMLGLTDDRSLELSSTSHISIVDANGNAVSLTTTIEDAFGARLMVRGFLLNNQLTDFSFVPAEEGAKVANRVQAGKRPRSSMAPTMVFDAYGRLVMTLGSPGGSTIINYVAKVLIGTLDWGLDIQQAIALPNFGSRNGPTELEQGRASDGLVKALEARGHTVRVMEQTSGLQGIMRTPTGWFGGADPRREGVARGDGGVAR